MFELEINNVLYQVIRLNPSRLYPVGVLAIASNDPYGQIIDGLINQIGDVFNRSYDFTDRVSGTVYPITRNQRLFYHSRSSNGDIQFAKWSGSRFYASKSVSMVFSDGKAINQEVISYYFHHQLNNDYFKRPDNYKRQRFDLDVNGVGLHSIETAKGTLSKRWAIHTDGYIYHYWIYNTGDSPDNELKSVDFGTFD